MLSVECHSPILKASRLRKGKKKKKERESPRKIISRCRSKGTMARNDRQRENDWDAARRKTRLGTNGLENAGWRQHRAEERHPGPLTTLAYKLWFLIMLLHPQTSTLSTTFFPPCPEGGNQYRKLGRLSMSLDVVRGMRTYVSFNLSRFPRQLSLFLSQTIRSSLTVQLALRKFDRNNLTACSGFLRREVEIDYYLQLLHRL